MKPPKRFQAVLFDLDGTLIDTEMTAAKAVHQSFRHWGLDVDPQDAAYITGRTWETAFSFLFSKYPIPVPREQAEKTIMQTYRESIEKDLITVPGGVDSVRALGTQYPLALVSGSRRSEILFALDSLGITHLFRVILGAEDYPRSKPEPDGYLKALGILGALAHQSLVFEDSTAGIASARAAGLWVVAITGTNHFHQDTTQAHRHIPDLTPVTPQWVAQLADQVLA